MQPPNIHPTLNTITSSLFRVSAKVIIIQTTTVLMVKEEQGWYGLPGGGIDHGEPVLDTLIREVNEEIGLTITMRNISPLPIAVDSTAIFDGIPRFTLLYAYENTEENIKPSNVELEYKWVSVDDLLSLTLAPNIAPFKQAVVSAMANKG